MSDGSRASDGNGRTVWLASYPKSGSTWLRAILAAMSTDSPQRVQLDQLPNGGQPSSLADSLPALGLNPASLGPDACDVLRDWLIRIWGDGGERSFQLPERWPRRLDPDAPIYRKTHERFRPGPVRKEAFPAEATKGAVLIVRDPRDVAVSYAHFFAVSIDDAIAVLADERAGVPSDAGLWWTDEPRGSWSSHATSWLSEDVPFPVEVVRYEELHVRPTEALTRVIALAGGAVAEGRIDRAIELARFDQLRREEDERGFEETSPVADRFFRSGRTGEWRDVLSSDQVQRIESDHGRVMRRFGYALTTSPASSMPRPEQPMPRGHRTDDAWLR